MSITWDGSLAMGLPEIDEQHHRFVDLLAKLEAAIENHDEAKHLNDVFEELEQYVKYHFGNEEHHFDEFGCYPNAPAHKRDHATFTAYVRQLRYQFIDDIPKGAAELARAMYHWLQHHIATMDREYEECFKEHGMGEQKKT
jgi:hemerythrin-like metal-binding protein